MLEPGRRGPRIVHEDVFRRLCRARDRIAANATGAISLEDAAREAGLSKFHFLRIFRQVFGETPQEFRTRLRISRACDLLEWRRDLTVTDVCLEVGFSSLGSFSSLFAKRVGVAPSAYRARSLVVVPERLVLRSIPGCFLLRFGGGAFSQF